MKNCKNPVDVETFKYSKLIQWRIMGRIKTSFIKRITLKLYKEHSDDFKKNFKENKEIVRQYLDVSSKKLRNTIAGYITRLARNQENI